MYSIKFNYIKTFFIKTNSNKNVFLQTIKINVRNKKIKQIRLNFNQKNSDPLKIIANNHKQKNF